jgi:hypothetical protein
MLKTEPERFERKLAWIELALTGLIAVGMILMMVEFYS